MHDAPKRLFVSVQVYRDMVKLGDECTIALEVGAGSRNVAMPPAGGLQFNSAAWMRVRLDNVMPFVDGWFTGITSFEMDAYLIGHWRQFQFNARNDDCPSVVHYEPSIHLVGFQPVTGIDQYVYSVSIKPTFPQDSAILTTEQQEPAIGGRVTDRWGRSFTRVEAGWVNSWYYQDAQPWTRLLEEFGPLLLAPVSTPADGTRS